MASKSEGTGESSLQLMSEGDTTAIRFVLDQRVDGTVGVWRRCRAGEASGAPVDSSRGGDLPALEPTLSRCPAMDVVDLVAARLAIARSMLLARYGRLEQHRFERYPLVAYELRLKAQVFWRLEVVPDGTEARMREAFI